MLQVKSLESQLKEKFICKSVETCCPISEDDLLASHDSDKNRIHQTQAKIANSIIDVIGNTPLVRLNKIPQSMGLKCEVLAKCENLNPGGSMKDRTALKMIEMAEEQGIIKPGETTLVEPTSGNTGIALALIASLKGYSMSIAIPEKMSKEKVDLMKCLGAEVIQTPTGLPPSDPASNFGVCEEMQKQGKGVMLDQFKNPANPLIHYEQTAEEILEQCEGKIDYLFAGAGTGGSISGIAKKLKEKSSNCKIVGCDPIGSLYADPSRPDKVDMTFQVEGVGYNFIPKTLEHSLIDSWEQYNDEQAFTMARRMIKEEGILCGGSSGGNMYCALKLAKELGLDERHRIVVIVHDSVRNYMSKFLSNEWMIEQGFIKHMKSGKEVNISGLQKVSSVLVTASLEQVISQFKEQKVSQLLVKDNNNTIIGIIKLSAILKELSRTQKRIQNGDNISKLIQKKFVLIKEQDADVELVQMLVERNGEVLIKRMNEDVVVMGQLDLLEQLSCNC